jgi:hypothetical protein
MAEISFGPTSLDQEDIDPGLTHHDDDEKSDGSTYIHEFLACAILDFQSDTKDEIVIEPLRSLPEGSVLKPPVNFLRKRNTRANLAFDGSSHHQTDQQILGNSFDFEINKQSQCGQ